MLALVGAQAHQASHAGAVSIGVGLRDDHLAPREGGPHGLRPSLAEPEAGHATGLEADGHDLHRPARSRHDGAARGAGARHPGRPGETPDHLGVEGGVGAASHEARRGDVDVGPQRAVEPLDHRFAEARDHDAHAHGGRDRDHERGDGHRRPRERAGDTPGGHASEEPEAAAGHRTQDAQETDGRGGREESAADQHEEEREKAQAHPRVGEQEQRSAGGEERRPGPGGGRHGPASARVEARAGQDLARARARRLQGGSERGGERGAQPQDGAHHESERGQEDLPDREHEIEVVDGARDEPEQPLRHDNAEGEPRRGADGPDGESLDHHEGEDLSARDAQRPEHADERAALDHREGHGVVDEEHADDEGEKGQRGQVEGEGARHLRRRVRARSRAGELGAGRKRAGDAPEERFPARVVGDDQIDAREPAGRVEQLLGGGDVGDEQRVERASGERVGRLDEPHEPDLAPASAQSQGEGIAGSEAERRRGCARDEGRARPRHEIGEGVGGRAPAESLTARRQVWPEGLLREWIDAEEMKGAPGEVSGRSIPLDDGRRASGPEPHAEVAVYGLGQPRRPAHDLMRGAAGDGLGGEVEGAPRAVVGEMDGHGHGDAEGDAEHGEPDLPRMPQQVPEARAPEQATHEGAADEGSTSCPCWTVKT